MHVVSSRVDLVVTVVPSMSCLRGQDTGICATEVPEQNGSFVCESTTHAGDVHVPEGLGICTPTWLELLLFQEENIGVATEGLLPVGDAVERPGTSTYTWYSLQKTRMY